jgi:hypothetical protein
LFAKAHPYRARERIFEPGFDIDDFILVQDERPRGDEGSG